MMMSPDIQLLIARYRQSDLVLAAERHRLAGQARHAREGGPGGAGPGGSPVARTAGSWRPAREDVVSGGLEPSTSRM
jgi:hypothetical protein